MVRKKDERLRKRTETKKQRSFRKSWKTSVKMGVLGPFKWKTSVKMGVLGPFKWNTSVKMGVLGPFKCYVTQWGGVGGCQLSRKKALRGCTVQRY